MIKFDGHVHTPYCPHGSKDPLESYAERALQLGLTGITFTEHAPLPRRFTDPVPDQDSAMCYTNLFRYVDEVNGIKEKYKGKIDICLGLEVDYIEGFEQETKALLEEVGDSLDDSILSVHFLKWKEEYYCIDFSDDEFERMSTIIGSVEEIYRLYFKTVEMSIRSDLGKFKPNRIGHITLSHKFQKRFPVEQSFQTEIYEILKAVKQNNLQLDYNSAGIKKPLCLETYPPESIAIIADQMGIPLVYGSDAHSVAGLLQGAEAISKRVKLQTPIHLSKS